MKTRTALIFTLFCLPLSGLAQRQIPLVTGKAITPLGKQTEVGSFPCNMAASPDGRYLVVTNAGYRQFLSVLRVSDGTLASQIEIGKERTDGSRLKEGLYYGLAFDASGTLYVSRGAEDRVAIYRLDSEGKLTDTGRSLSNPSGTPEFKSPHHIAGVAVGQLGKRVYAANNQTSTFTDLKGSLSILDTETNKLVGKVALPGFPYAVAVMAEFRDTDKKVYVSSERDGVVSVVDSKSLQVTGSIKTGVHPVALLLDKAQKRLFVANAGSDTISIVDTATDKVTTTVPLRPGDVRGLPGATPLGLALSPGENLLFVALADMNAVAVVDTAAGTVLGYLPTGWYPTAVAVSPDGKRLFVANAKGVQIRHPNHVNAGPMGAWGKYIENILEGTVSTIDLSETLTQLDTRALAQNVQDLGKRMIQADTLLRHSTQVVMNNRFAPKLEQAGKSLLANPGIKHVIYIIKENRTYDQVLGDLKQGNGDPSLVLFGRDVTPNQHALAERFVLLDNFYCCAEVSADGWNWSTSGMASEYTARNSTFNYSKRGKAYDFEGSNNGTPVDLRGIPDVATAPGGYFWDLCAKKGVSFRNYGMFTIFADPDDKRVRSEGDRERENIPTKRVLTGKTDEDFRLYDMSYADSDAWVKHNAPAPRQKKAYGKYAMTSRIAEWRREWEAFEKKGDLPRMMFVRLGRDHTSGTRPGEPSPRACVADNDYAVGQMVETVSHSKFWKETVICIVEDDAQNGYDHVDAHRSIAFVISPYIKKGTVDSRFYNTDSMLRTMEILLGLPPMNQYDAIAAPLAVFDKAAENAEPYAAILPDRKIIAEVNGATTYRAKDSARLNFRDADAVPDDVMNDILWHAVKGRNTPKPTVRHGVRLVAERKPVKQPER